MIDALKYQFPVSWLCWVLETSRASYYKWMCRKTSQYEMDDQGREDEI